MGAFSEIASEARQGMAAPARQAAAPSAAPEPALAPPAAAPEAPAARPAPPPPAPAEAATPPQAEPVSSAHTPPPPEVRLAVAQDTPQDTDDTAARQAHEEAEAQRKAEWDAQQAEKEAKRQAALDRIKAMNDAEILSAAVGRVAADTERLTRRNMKLAIAEYIGAKCREDAAFAVLVLDPEKSMIHCFQYINRMAKKFIEDAIKAETPDPKSGIYGDDVPDHLVYMWAENYFTDPNAEEDHKNEEKFVPKPYVPAVHKKASGKTAQKPSRPAKPRSEKPPDAGMEQLTLGVM